MPQAAAAWLVANSGLFAAGSAAAAAATTAGTIAITAAMVAGSNALARREARKARARANSELEDRRFTVRSSSEPQQIIIGRTRAGGVQVVPGWTWGTNKENWTTVVAFAGHEIVGFHDILLGEESAGPYDGSGSPAAGSKFYSFRDEPAIEQVTGSGIGGTYTFDDGAQTLRIDSIAYEDTESVMGQLGLPIRLSIGLVEGTDYSTSRVSGNLRITWLTDQTDRALTITRTRRTGETAYVTIRQFYGIAAGERDTALETNSGGEWTSTDVGKSIARLHVTFKYNSDIFPSGAPQLSAIVTGARHYDPRLDSTNGGSGAARFNDPSTWSAPNSDGANPALAAAWYLTSPLGFNAPFSRIDWPSVIAAANICDEAVALKAGGSQPRYRCSGVLSTADDRRTNLDKIIGSMAGLRFFSQGKWTLKAGAYSTPVMDLTDDDFADGTVQVMPRAKRRDLFNSVAGTFIDAANGYAPTSFPSYASPTYITQDGGEELWADIELPLVDNAARAQRIALLELNRSRQALTVAATFKPRTIRLQPDDRVTLTSATYGWTSKVFRVKDWSYVPHGLVSLVLQEDASVVYGWSAGDENVPDPAPNTALPDPRIVAPLANFRVSTGAVDELPDGTRVPYALATWSAITDSAVLSGGRIDLWWKRAVDSLYRKVELRPSETSARIEPVSGGDTINVVAWAVNGSQVRSIPVFATVGLDADLPAGTYVPPLSANLVKNAALAESAGGWTTGAGGGLSSAAVTFRRYTEAANSTIVGSPSNCALLIGTTATGSTQWGYVLSSQFAVTPGTDYCAFADLIGFATDAFVQIEWLEATENYISSSRGSIVPQNNVASANVWNDPTRYVRSSVIATAPSTARIARLAIVALGNWTSASTKFLSIFRPFCGEMPAGTTELPPWDAGGSNPVNTDLIAPGAATRVFKVATITGPISFTQSVTLAELVVSEDLRGYEIAVTATFDYHAQHNGASPAVIDTNAWLTMTDGGGTTLTGANRTLLWDRTFPVGFNATRSVEITQRWTVPATTFGPYTFRLQGREKFALVGSVIVSDASAIDLGVEVIKR